MPDGAHISPLDRWKWAVTVPVERATDRAVLSCLAESADRRTLTTTRTLRTLAAQSGTNERGALKALARLEARGLVTIERRGRRRADSPFTAANVGTNEVWRRFSRPSPRKETGTMTTTKALVEALQTGQVRLAERDDNHSRRRTEGNH